MKLMKKVLAVCMAASIAAGLTACGMGADTKWIAKSGDLTVPAGVYIGALMNQYYDVTAELGEDVKSPLKESVDGVAVPQKIMDGAKENLETFIAVEQKFSELGLTIDSVTEQSLSQNVESYWQFIGPTYEKNGVSKQSYLMMFANDAKRSQIFTATYGEGGSNAVPEAELKEKFLKDYAKIIVIPLNFSASEDPEQVAKDTAAAKEMIAKYEQKLKAGGNMEDIVFEAQKEISKDPDSLTKPEPGSSYTFVSRDNSQYADNVTQAIFNAKMGEPVVAESEESIYLFVRYDISENENDFISRKTSILSQLKYEEFDAMVKAWEVNDVSFNDAAFKRYTPANLKL